MRGRKSRYAVTAAILLALGSGAWAQLAPPQDPNEARLERWVQMAELQLAAEKQFQTKSKHFIVTTDSKTQETAPRIAGNLEATYTAVDKLLGKIVSSRAEGGPIHVYVFKERSRFESLRTQLGVAEFADGFYAPPGFMAFPLVHPVVEILLGVMIHETVHAYLDRYVIPPGAVLPIWLNEGFASYIGQAEVYQGELVLGSHERTMNYHDRGGIVRGRSPWMQNVDKMRAAFKNKTAIPVGDLLTATNATFKGANRELYYTEACMLVQVLNEGRDGWAADKFPKLMKRLAAGEKSADAIRAVYGLDTAGLESELRDFVKGF